MHFVRPYATLPLALSKYPPRKQLVWNACTNYLKKPVMLLVQLNNLDTPSTLKLKFDLAALGLSLKTPKPHILRKAVKLSQYSNLEGSIIGPTGILLSNKEPHELQAGLHLLAAQRKVFLIGGKIGNHTFSLEGIKDAICNLPPKSVLTSHLVSLLQSPSMALADTLNSAPAALASALDQHVHLQTTDSEK